MYSKKSSFLISESVKMKQQCLPNLPVVSKYFFMSYFKSFSPQFLTSSICLNYIFSMNAAKRVTDCFPLPPTPTNKADERGCFKILVSFNKCFKASLNKTSLSFLGLFEYQLQLFIYSQPLRFKYSMSAHASQFMGDLLVITPYSYTSGSRKSLNKNSLSLLNF